MSAIKLAPLDTPHQFNHNNHHAAATGGGGGGGGIASSTTRRSFNSEGMPIVGGGVGVQPLPVETEEVDGNKKDNVRMRVGYYQMDKKHNVRYVFIPKGRLCWYLTRAHANIWLAPILMFDSRRPC